MEEAIVGERDVHTWRELVDRNESATAPSALGQPCLHRGSALRKDNLP